MRTTLLTPPPLLWTHTTRFCPPACQPHWFPCAISLAHMSSSSICIDFDMRCRQRRRLSLRRSERASRDGAVREAVDAIGLRQDFSQAHATVSSPSTYTSRHVLCSESAASGQTHQSSGASHQKSPCTASTSGSVPGADMACIVGSTQPPRTREVRKIGEDAAFLRHLSGVCPCTAR